MLVREVVEDAAVGVGMAHTPEGLNAIHRPGCAAAIWNREMAPDLQEWVAKLDPKYLPQGRVVLHRDAVLEAVYQLCQIAGTPDDPERDLLVEDIGDMSRLFSDLMAVHFLRLRLDVVSTNACRKFHIDSILARMICTYRGTGTQYGISTDGEEPRRVFTVATGAPMVLRGTLWPDGPKSGLLHRSPPIEGTGETRLVLVLDPVNDLENRPVQRVYH
ncbi:MAG: DUF1826 domain-containing protein [Pseudomonadota bacterium]